jgi:regulator of protease activity HflC (stomatin/prohibitin superfamily)
MPGDIIIKDTHRALWYEDGVLKRVLGAGRYQIPSFSGISVLGIRRPRVEVTYVDVRERELTIKGQDILTSDKVSIRVSIIVQFRVTDPTKAVHEVESYEVRLYSDVQLAARRSLASMALEQILTNRNQLSEDILADVKETAARYGVMILRADHEQGARGGAHERSRSRRSANESADAADRRPEQGGNPASGIRIVRHRTTRQR